MTHCGQLCTCYFIKSMELIMKHEKKNTVHSKMKRIRSERLERPRLQSRPGCSALCSPLCQALCSALCSALCPALCPALYSALCPALCPALCSALYPAICPAHCSALCSALCLQSTFHFLSANWNLNSKLQGSEKLVKVSDTAVLSLVLKWLT